MNLKDVKKSLLEKHGELQARLEKITSDLRHESGVLSPDFGEQAVERENDEVLEELEVSIQAALEEITHCLEKIDKGTYGICETCGKTINPERLEAIPRTSHCISCAS